jgi:carbonic anhydrase/acetyltransferase-like protein (isoleucine patch superfamily)
MLYLLGDRKPILKGDNYVAPNAAVIGSVLMERNASVWFSVTIRGDNDLITLGENVNVQDNSVIHTDGGIPVTLERNVSIGHLVMLHGCHIQENSLIGIGAIILNRVTVGKNCLIGAGSLVPEGKTIPDGSLVLGCARQGGARADARGDRHEYVDRAALRGAGAGVPRRTQGDRGGPQLVGVIQ